MNRPVAIAGMHRSGTSMVTRLLQEAGLYLGDAADLMPPAEENPEGFYEHLGFVRLNDELLNAAGAGWDCPPPAGVDWSSGAFTAFREEATLLAAPLAADRVWGWKDPRTSLTLPFWRSALGPLRTVVVVRNPLEVVTSLHRRNGFSFALALTLWQIYAERILQDTSPEQRLITHYDAYFLKPEQEISRLLAFCGLALAEEQDIAVIRAAALPELRHHQRTIHHLEDAGFPAETIALYRRLAREAEWWEGMETPDSPAAERPPTAAPPATIARGVGGVDLLRVENEVLRHNNADFTNALASRESRIAELETALANHETMRAELDGKIAERDSRLIERNALIARRDHALAEQHQQIARLGEEVAALTERLGASEHALAAATIHEREMRSMLTGLEAIQLGRDVEIMGTLGAVLSRHAPGAPASIYHRLLIGQVRRFADDHIPADARTLVASYGDGAMLALGDRPTEPFPRAPSGVIGDYTDVSESEAVAQLEARRDEGASFLLVPGPALPWLASHPGLKRHVEHHCPHVAHERGIGTIYALGAESVSF